MRFGFVAALLTLSSLAAAQGGGAPAGGVIRNVADARYVVDGTEQATRSNAVTDVIAERLDVALAVRPDVDTSANDAPTVPFVLTNRGNGTEPFVLTSPAVPAGLSVVGFAPDADGDGRPDAGGLLDGGVTASIAAGASAGFVLILGPDAGASPAADGSATIVARAATGSGEPGAVIAGRGDGGGDAVLGPTGGTATLTAPVAVQMTEGTIEKSQAVRAPDGSERGVPGATITYTLRARPGAGTRAAQVDDPIPIGTRYVAGSLRMDGAPISDADDADPGGCDGTRVTVALPDGGGGTLRTISFQVIIQ